MTQELKERIRAVWVGIAPDVLDTMTDESIEMRRIIARQITAESMSIHDPELEFRHHLTFNS